MLRQAGDEDGLLGQSVLMLTIDMPEKVREILHTLRDAGYEAYIVGGCVRDALLGREPNDWDITTSALPMQVKALFPHTVDTGLQHGTVTVIKGKEGFEVTTYRVDGVYEDGRHPKEVTFTPDLAQDLCRRDFTINAMAYSDSAGLVDLFGGREDMENRLIRAVGEPARRFEEDALRIMRAVRFAAQLGYSLEPRTMQSVKALAPTLSRISQERIRVELEKTILSDRPQMFRLMYETGITAQILPEFDRCMEMDQRNPHHCYNVGDHILASMENVRPDRVLRLTMLLHDIGKPDCLTTDERGVDHFYGHAERSMELAGAILRRLKYDNAAIRSVTTLVRDHYRAIRLTPAGVRRAVVRTGEDLFPLLLEVKRADMEAKSEFSREQNRAQYERLTEIYDGIVQRGDCLRLQDLAVKGADLMEAGVKPGPEMGGILQQMLEEVLAEPDHNNREYLLGNFLRRITDSKDTLVLTNG